MEPCLPGGVSFARRSAARFAFLSASAALNRALFLPPMRGGLEDRRRAFQSGSSRSSRTRSRSVLVHHKCSAQARTVVPSSNTRRYDSGACWTGCAIRTEVAWPRSSNSKSPDFNSPIVVQPEGVGTAVSRLSIFPPPPPPPNSTSRAVESMNSRCFGCGECGHSCANQSACAFVRFALGWKRSLGLVAGDCLPVSFSRDCSASFF